MSLVTDSWDDVVIVLKMAQEARATPKKAKAYSYYVRATQLDPNNAVAWEGRAATSTEVEDAILSWGYVLALKPENSVAREMLAQRVQERIAHSTPSDVDNLISIGRDLAQAGQKDFAHQLFLRATALAERNSEAWVWRAGATDSPEESVMCLNRALALDPGNKKAEAGLHWLLTQKIAPTQFASPQMMRHAAQQISEGQRLVHERDKSRAHEFFTRATELDRTNISAWLWRASTTQDVDEALICVEQALLLNPGNKAALAAREFLRERKRGDPPHSIAPTGVLIAPLQTPEGAPKQNLGNLIIAIGVILILLALFMFLRNVGINP